MAGRWRRHGPRTLEHLVDTVLYLGVLFNGVPEFGAMLKSGVIAKGTAGLVFGILIDASVRK